MTKRATSLPELFELMAPMFAGEREAYGTFQPRSTDVIISPFAKCGTTWLQQIVHGLRTGGDMDFTDIYEVVPWFDVAPVLGMDLNADQRATPRAFKSHKGWNDVPRGCRYIVSFRDPKDAVVSFYRFMEGWFLEPGAIPLDEFVAQRMFDLDQQDTYWTHASSWLSQRDNPDVLLLTFEDMKDNLRGVVHRIARFLDLDDDPRIDVAVEHATFEFMSTHDEPFSEPLLREWVEENVGIPADS
ncbi:MAG: sulfotransferase domain-containing protein, partial [Halobacteriales archaeon]|nr:sulfotransferase domain-containing protein [Halobacteriales archaeon]